MSAETRELIAAIRDALDPPEPATPEGWSARDRLMVQRAAYLVGVLGAHLDLSDSDVPSELAVTARTVRSVAETFPVTYRTKTKETAK